jgi:hypothetical protein
MNKCLMDSRIYSIRVHGKVSSLDDCGKAEQSAARALSNAQMASTLRRGRLDSSFLGFNSFVEAVI